MSHPHPIDIVYKFWFCTSLMGHSPLFSGGPGGVPERYERVMAWSLGGLGGGRGGGWGGFWKMNEICKIVKIPGKYV